MGIKERKERQREEIKNLIIKAAQEIIAEDGISNLSVRKIASKIEYSPAIIYHYFISMDELITQLVTIKFQLIIDELRNIEIVETDPEKRLMKSIRNYIEISLKYSEEYKAFLLNDSQAILQYTAILHKGVAQKRQSIAMLFRDIKKITEDNISDDEAELTAQNIWCSTFGLIIRLILEKDISEEQKQLVIKQHIEFLLAGIKHIRNIK